MDEKIAKLQRLHKYCTNNFELLTRSKKCYCFYCKATIDAKEVLKNVSLFCDGGETAICPICNIDSILPSAIDEDITAKDIEDMNKYWFSSNDYD